MQGFLVDLLESALARIREHNLIPADTQVPVEVERPRESGHGDFATNLAMRLAKPAGQPPRDLAQALVEALPATEEVAQVEVAGPGFINFHLSEAVFQRVVPEVLRSGADFGRSDVGGGERVQVEMVSANPTGPLHVGHGRGAAYGDALARVMRAAGYRVEQEYYVNDAGRQMAILAVSVLFRYLAHTAASAPPFPEKGYHGDYVTDIAAELAEADGDHWVLDHDALLGERPADEDGDARMDGLIRGVREAIGADGLDRIRRFTLERILATIGDDLAAFGVPIDHWTPEQAMVDDGAVEHALERLRTAGHLYEAEDATWFRATDFGDEKDRVVVRGDGAATYFANDIGYHARKFERGYNHLIDIWGADHHGYVDRVRGAMAALGHNTDRLEILLVQFANLYRGAEKIPMSTRAGRYVTLRELMDEVGRDAARFFYVLRRADQHMDFDLELAKRHTEDNPVYYIHYAHVRISSIQAKLADAGHTLPGPAELAAADVSRLTEAKEGQLLRALQRYPETVASAAKDRSPHRVARYLQELAAEFHTFYNSHRVLVDDDGLLHARLALVEGVRQVLANGLDLLGVAAPERM